MPLLCSLGTTLELSRVQAALQEDEVLLALLDDTHTVTSHKRTATAFAALQGALMIKTGIHLNPGKTKIWNVAGGETSRVRHSSADRGNVRPTATVWRGSDLPTCQQVMKILGTPLGHPDFVRASLESKNASHQRFLDRIPLLQDVQASWLLLVHCAAARANYMTWWNLERHKNSPEE